MILDLIGRNISKKVNFGLKYLRVVGVEEWGGNPLYVYYLFPPNGVWNIHVLLHNLEILIPTLFSRSFLGLLLKCEFEHLHYLHFPSESCAPVTEKACIQSWSLQPPGRALCTRQFSIPCLQVCVHQGSKWLLSPLHLSKIPRYFNPKARGSCNPSQSGISQTYDPAFKVQFPPKSHRSFHKELLSANYLTVDTFWSLEN